MLLVPALTVIIISYFDVLSTLFLRNFSIQECLPVTNIFVMTVSTGIFWSFHLKSPKRSTADFHFLPSLSIDETFCCPSPSLNLALASRRRPEARDFPQSHAVSLLFDSRHLMFFLVHFF